MAFLASLTSATNVQLSSVYTGGSPGRWHLISACVSCTWECVAQVEPISSCPMGYKIARTPVDYQYGPCRPLQRIPPKPTCDSPFVLDPAVGRCLYNSTHPGYLGCPPGARNLNETACAVAKQVLRTPECPPGNEAILLVSRAISSGCHTTGRFTPLLCWFRSRS